MKHKNQSSMARNLDDVSICTSVTKSRDFSWIENYKLICDLYIIISNKICGMHFFVRWYISDWVKDNALKSLGECIALLWFSESVNYLLLLLLPEWTVFSIAGNMCSKDLDEQYTPGIVFLFCTALVFILMSLLQMHYICSTLCGV